MKKRNLLILAIILVLCLMAGCKKNNIPPKDEGGEHVHEFSEWEVKSEPSCYIDGYKQRDCKNCSESETEIIPAAHKYTEATCMARAKCEVCGEKTGSFAEHNFSEWEIKSEPTCVLNGLKEHKCVWCGLVESFSTPAYNHNFTEWKVLQNSTCTENGLREHTCNTCHEVIREETPKIEHNFAPWEVQNEATCVVEGVSMHCCVACGLEEVQTISMREHQYSAWTVEKDASCHEVGIMARECSVCHKCERTATAASEHEYTNLNGINICKICGSQEDNINVLSSAIDAIKLTVNANDENGLVLPEEINVVSIVWKSMTPNIVTDDGTIFASRLEQTAIMVGQFNYNETSMDKIFEVTIPVMDVGTQTYSWNAYFSKKVLNETASNLVFITKPYGDCKVFGYETSNPDIITKDGRITQKLYDQSATITCYLQYGKVISTYSKKVIVKSYTDNQIVEMVSDWVPTMVEKLQNGEATSLPYTDGLYGTTINWFCMEPGIFAGNGIFVKPDKPMDLEIKCTVVYKQCNRQLTFNLTNIGGNMTKVDQLREWIKGQIPTRIMGTKNFVLENDALDYQIRTNSGGVLNLIDGANPIVDRSMLIDETKKTWVNKCWGSGSLNTLYHPFVSQEILNKMMYEGYLLPNENNILWITVHESGMPRVNNDAKLLAQIQMDTATGKRSREASWNYQVDEKSIYQSFEDDVICWHAGDGTKTIGNGNNNSIGIEMCINEDGNYDGAMYNDAKLIAMLLHKYNLSLVNVKRHYDWSGKVCPNYMITQGRWLEFLSLVDKEYTAMSLLKDAKVSWTVTTDDNNNTEEVLDTYFTKGASTIYMSKPVSKKVVLHITMTVEYEGEVFTHSQDLTLYPDK